MKDGKWVEHQDIYEATKSAYSYSGRHFSSRIVFSEGFISDLGSRAWPAGWQRIRDVSVAPDGAIMLVVTIDGKGHILRLSIQMLF